MTIRDFWIDPRVNGGGTGKQSAPFKTLTEAAAAMGKQAHDINRLHCRADAHFFEPMPRALVATAYVGLEMDMYGGNGYVTIDSTRDISSLLIYDSGRDWFIARGIGTTNSSDKPGKKTLGVVLEEGVALPMYAWNADLWQVRNAMHAGGYCYDWATGDLFVAPQHRGAKNYRMADKEYTMYLSMVGPHADDVDKYNWVFHGIRFVGGKRHGVFISAKKFVFEGCATYGNGGQQINEPGVSSSHLGNGIEVSVASKYGAFRGCDFRHAFDSGLTFQAYGDGHFADDGVVERCTFDACGFYGVELSIQAGNASTSVQNILVQYNNFKNSIESFAYNIHSSRHCGFCIIQNAKGILDHIVVRRNNFLDLYGTAVKMSECGTDVHVEHNFMRNCKEGVYNTGTGISSRTTVNNNTFQRCPVALRTNFSDTRCGTDQFDNIIEMCDVAYKDTCTVNAPVTLNRNVMNATRAIEAAASRSAITGGGNTSTGQIDPAFQRLF